MGDWPTVLVRYRIMGKFCRVQIFTVSADWLGSMKVKIKKSFWRVWRRFCEILNFWMTSRVVFSSENVFFVLFCFCIFWTFSKQDHKIILWYEMRWTKRIELTKSSNKKWLNAFIEFRLLVSKINTSSLHRMCSRLACMYVLSSKGQHQGLRAVQLWVKHRQRSDR